MFLLSYAELDRFYFAEEERMCVPTEYAAAQGALISSRYDIEGRETSQWWLRTLGNWYIAYVVSDGGLFSFDDVSSGINAVRPVMWVDLDALTGKR